MHLSCFALHILWLITNINMQAGALGKGQKGAGSQGCC